MNLVVVESPAKAKTINKFLGSEYKVLASYGHIRDIEEKKGIDVENDFKIHYQDNDSLSKHLKEIKKCLNDADKLYLATDQDREGEAIAWHLKTVLSKNNKLENIQVYRITFNEITKEAITKALTSPREINMNLVNAYQARRSLDYLMGFSLSPLLIRKFPGCKSAGRVQSVALKLISERENEIQKFLPKEYWSILTNIKTEIGDILDAKLNIYKGKKIGKLDIENEKTADEIISYISKANLSIFKIESKEKNINPYAAFMTSTLQLEANNKLNFSPSRTMSLAQNLYEGININGENKGLITYMRTDSVNLSDDFLYNARNLISKDFGSSYLNKEIRYFKNKVKNAQEAHEAIRPSDINIRPNHLPKSLDTDLKKLYDLIWRRSLATQATPAISETTTIKIGDFSKETILSAAETTLKFQGYKKIINDVNLNDQDSSTINYNKFSENTAVKDLHFKKKQHFTDPPPRYSETSLIKKLEEYGIGRPSTYANIMKKNLQRGYVKLSEKRFLPQPTGRIVSSFLNHYFENYVDYNFTASKENELDEVSQGQKDWIMLLKDFWKDFNEKVQGTLKLSNTEVYDYINKSMKEFLFPSGENNNNSRTCPKCNKAELSIKMRKNGTGPFVACTSHPDCNYIRSSVFPDNENAEELIEDKLIGYNENDIPILLRKGPYGIYLQLGEKNEKKPKRISIPKNLSIEDINLDKAKELLILPRLVGKHPETGKEIISNFGRYGPYIKYENSFFSMSKEEDPTTIGLNRAMDILSKPKKTNRRVIKPLKVIGKHPIIKEDINLFKGKYGYYIKFKQVNYSLPKTLDAEKILLKEAINIIEKKSK